MKNFTITCTIKDELTKLCVKLKQSSITSFNIYKNNKWIGSVNKNANGHYNLTSYSKFFVVSQTDVNAIGDQINAHVKLNRYNTGANVILNAA